MSENINKKKNKKIIIVVILIVILAIIGLGVFILNKKLNDRHVLENPGEELGYDIPIGNLDAEVIDSKAQGRNLNSEIKAVSATYKEAKAWLKVPGTTIDTPVFQSTDNVRYYRNDRDNKKTKWGETFLDYRCDINGIGTRANIIVYGHNTETDTHFTPLLNYKKEEFYKKHRFIELATDKGLYKFQVFSAYVTDTSFFYIDTNFSNNAEYANFVKSIKNRSKYDTTISVGTSDTILTLSTCDYSIKDGRFVIHAKLVK